PSDQPRRYMTISVSWNLFTITAVSILAAYYAIVLLIFYRAEIKQWIRSRVAVRSTDAKLPDIGHGPSIMGRTRADNTVEVMQAEAQELLIAPHEPGEEIRQNIIDKNEILIGSVADLLQEVNILIERIAEDRTGRSESKELFNALFLRYPHLQNSAYPQAISMYICEAAREKIQWEIKPHDVLSWWNNN
ncbi:MAG TPA: hypothetical protein VGK46_03005, partial [Saprospiraceae bacterium]